MQTSRSNEGDLAQRDSKHIIRPWNVPPLLAVTGKGAVLTDVSGKEYIDCTSGLYALNIGHSHPDVVKAIKDQAEKLVQVSAYQSSMPAIRLAEKLSSLTPKGIERVFYATVGGEAVELAMKMARMHTKRHEIIALRGAYHGLTFGAATVTGISHYKHGFGPLLAGIHHAMMPYCYRCPLRMEYPDCGAACADDVENTLTCSSAGDVAAMMLEPILGAGGVIIPPSEYFVRITEICRQHSLLLIIDEVQTGFGRSGKMFGFEHFDVHPDVMVFGKVLGGGLALAAVATNADIASTFRSFPSTLAANALACAAGLKTIEVIQNEKLHEKAARAGEYLEKRLLELAEGSPVIGDVRCRGLMCGIEFVEEKKKPEPTKVLGVIDRLREKGVLSLGAGIYGNVLRIQPPLTITEEQLDTVVERLEEALNEEQVNSSR